MSTEASTKPAAITRIPAAPRVSRALLALVGAATVAVTPVAGLAFGPAGSGRGAHSSPVYVLARLSRDIGHDDWAFQGGLTGRIDWAAGYLALGLFWLAAALWIRRRTAGAAGRRGLWLKALAAAWGAEITTVLLAVAAGLFAQRTSSWLGPVALRAADLCSPWWSCAVVLVVVARAELNAAVLRAAAGYSVLLAVLLLVELPGPDALKVLVLAAAVAVPAFLTTDPPEEGTAPGPLRPGGGAAG